MLGVDGEWREWVRMLRPLRVGVLCSRRAPGLRHLLTNDANCGALYEIACCLTSEESFEEEPLVASHGIAVIRHPIRRFSEARALSPFNLDGRRVYDAWSVERLAEHQLDVIVLAGYLYTVTEPMLACFRNRIINVHHSDLTERDERGGARFPGLRAVRDALVGGARETRATLHLVTPQVDEGPPLVRSWAFPVSPLVSHALAWRNIDMVKAYGYAHQEWMIRATWGPLLSAALQLIATGQINLTALAAAGCGRPWDLDANGVLHGNGPLARIETAPGGFPS